MQQLPVKGLKNGFRENNCFLNVVIQSLWNLESFRTSFIPLSHKCVNNEGKNTCVHCALSHIFKIYQYSSNNIIPPNILRNTLHNLFKEEEKFQIGSIDDAAEVLDAILENLHKTVQIEDQCVSHDVFGLSFVSQHQCGKCGARSKPISTSRFIEYLYVSTFREIHSQQPNIPFEALIKFSTQEFKGCPIDDDKKACKNIHNYVNRDLRSLPLTLSFGLVWPSNKPSPEEIASTLSMIRTQIDILKIFDNPIAYQFPNQKLTYQLRGMICYYGEHYNAYFYSHQHHCWIVFDDTILSKAGQTWNDIVYRCRRGHFHPSVLFYEIIPDHKSALTGFRTILPNLKNPLHTSTVITPTPIAPPIVVNPPPVVVNPPIVNHPPVVNLPPVVVNHPPVVVNHPPVVVNHPPVVVNPPPPTEAIQETILLANAPPPVPPKAPAKLVSNENHKTYQQIFPKVRRPNAWPRINGTTGFKVVNCN